MAYDKKIRREYLRIFAPVLFPGVRIRRTVLPGVDKGKCFSRLHFTHCNLLSEYFSLALDLGNYEVLSGRIIFQFQGHALAW